jgi:hypothetical protein
MQDTYALSVLHGGHLISMVEGDEVKAHSKGAAEHMSNIRYATKISLENELLTAYDDNEVTLTIKGSKVLRGSTILHVNSDHYVAIRSLVIECTLTEDLRAELALKLAMRELAAMGM